MLAVERELANANVPPGAQLRIVYQLPDKLAGRFDFDRAFDVHPKSSYVNRRAIRRNSIVTAHPSDYQPVDRIGRRAGFAGEAAGHLAVDHARPPNALHSAHSGRGML